MTKETDNQEEKAGKGRPTKLTPDVIEKAREYIDGIPNEIEVVPTMAGLSLYLKVARKTLENWVNEERDPEFLRIALEVKQKQEMLLVNKGLSGGFNHSITKLILSKHGYHEKTEKEVNVKGKPKFVLVDDDSE